MKRYSRSTPKILILAAAIAASVAAPTTARAFTPGEATVISAHATILAGGKVHVMIFAGFGDSTFDYDRHSPDLETRAFCFLGDISAVCGVIAADAAEMQKEYSEGAHDTIDVKSCAVKRSTEGIEYIDVAYNLSDDYGGNIDVVRRIDDCAS